MYSKNSESEGKHQTIILRKQFSGIHSGVEYSGQRPVVLFDLQRVILVAFALFLRAPAKDFQKKGKKKQQNWANPARMQVFELCVLSCHCCLVNYMFGVCLKVTVAGNSNLRCCWCCNVVMQHNLFSCCAIGSGWQWLATGYALCVEPTTGPPMGDSSRARWREREWRKVKCNIASWLNYCK